MQMLTLCLTAESRRSTECLWWFLYFLDLRETSVQEVEMPSKLFCTSLSGESPFLPLSFCTQPTDQNEHYNLQEPKETTKRHNLWTFFWLQSCRVVIDFPQLSHWLLKRCGSQVLCPWDLFIVCIYLFYSDEPSHPVVTASTLHGSIIKSLTLCIHPPDFQVCYECYAQKWTNRRHSVYQDDWVIIFYDLLLYNCPILG